MTGVFQAAGRFLTTGYAKWLPAPMPPPSPYLLDPLLLHHDVHVDGSLADVAQSIWDGTALIGTDGSVTPT